MEYRPYITGVRVSTIVGKRWEMDQSRSKLQKMWLVCCCCMLMNETGGGGARASGVVAVVATGETGVQNGAKSERDVFVRKRKN